MVIQGVDKKCENYLDHHRNKWEFGNSILYRMCEEHPFHTNEDIIAGKMWLIGRSYAAAIERRKIELDVEVEDFYYDIVAKKMLEIGTELDEHIGSLRETNTPIIDNLEEILTTHKLLMDKFEAITGLEKRSLASKYLHFHCPNMFFIYDSRARKNIGSFVRKPYQVALPNVACDHEYGIFVCKLVELQEYIHDSLGKYESPRGIDSFLLRY